MTANAGMPDFGLGPTTANGNAGTVLPAVESPSLPDVGLAPTVANGNAGSVFPPISLAFTVPLITPPAPAYALVLDVPVATLVLEGG